MSPHRLHVTNTRPTGCPFSYVPLSVQTPEFYGELQARQADVLGATESWHKCDLASADSPLLGPCGRPLSDHSGLENKLMAAISEPLEPMEPAQVAPPEPPQAHHIKTSSTHPIKYVPPALLPRTHLTPVTQHLHYHPPRSPRPRLLPSRPLRAPCADRLRAARQVPDRQTGGAVPASGDAARERAAPAVSAAGEPAAYAEDALWDVGGAPGRYHGGDIARATDASCAWRGGG